MQDELPLAFLVVWAGMWLVVFTVGFGALMFWGILRKSGRPGWHSLIPVLQWTEAAAAAGRNPKWGLGPGLFPFAWMAFFTAIFATTFSAMPQPGEVPTGEVPAFLPLLFVAWFLVLATEILAIIGHLYIAIGLRRTFATSDGMLVSMILVPVIGYAIVGLGQATYRGLPVEGGPD